MAAWKYAIALLVVVAGVESNCPNGWLTHDNVCYHFSHDTEDFPGAMVMCKLIGGELVTIDNATEGTYLATQAKLTNTNYWIAMTDQQEEGMWRWVYSHEQPDKSYRNWEHGQPDNSHHDQNCAYMSGTTTGKWADGSCSHALHFICERTSAVSTEIIG